MKNWSVNLQLNWEHADNPGVLTKPFSGNGWRDHAELHWSLPGWRSLTPPAFLLICVKPSAKNWDLWPPMAGRSFSA